MEEELDLVLWHRLGLVQIVREAQITHRLLVIGDSVVGHDLHPNALLQGLAELTLVSGQAWDRHESAVVVPLN